MINTYRRKNELARQLLHMSVGAVLLIILFFLPLRPENALAFATLVSLAFLLYILIVIHRRTLHKRSPFVDYLLASLEREGAPPAYGAMWYAIGALLALAFIQTPAGIASAIILLAIADGLSTIVGMHGSHPLPYNRHKSVEGTSVFFLTGLCTYFLIGWLAVPLSIITSIVESTDFGLDDNLTIPAVCILFFKLV